MLSFLQDPTSFLPSVGHILSVTSFFLLRHPFFLCFYSLYLCPLFFSPLCEKPHSNPFPSFVLLPFCSLAHPPFTSDISQMAYSNWNLPLCQDKKTSVSPKHYPIELKCDSLLCSVSFPVLLLFCVSFSFFSVFLLLLSLYLLPLTYIKCNTQAIYKHYWTYIISNSFNPLYIQALIIAIPYTQSTSDDWI